MEGTTRRQPITERHLRVFDEYSQVAFWQDLDIIGINAYFPLRENFFNHKTQKQQIKQEMLSGWQKVFKEIINFTTINKLANKPVLFTELGYTRKQDATILSWSAFGQQLVKGRIINWETQALVPNERVWAMESLYQTAKLQKNKLKFAGLLYWKLSTIKSHWEIEPFVHVLTDKTDENFNQSLRQFNSK